MPLKLLSACSGLMVAFTISAGAFGPAQVAAGNLSDFKSPLDNSPMTFPLHDGEVETAAVKNFKATGVNEYRGNPEAIVEGERLYSENCIICHGADATGRMGPTLVGEDLVYPQAMTDPGMFSIVYGGASGAMQSFFRRGMEQDQMLKIIAYVRTLDK
jgi:cytochrome c-L